MKVISCKLPDLNILHGTKFIVVKPRLNVVMLFVLLLGFVTLINADNYQRKLKRFRFHPQKNSSCYQVYTSADKVDGYSCKRPHEESKRSCVTQFKGNDSYCEISTPSGERVIVPCTRPTEPDPTRDFGTDLDYSYLTLESSIECYEVYKSGFDRKELCPEVLPPLATGIVTPDGYTILLQSKLCKTYKSKEEINADKEFTSSFNFDPEERSCYKFYKPDQFISSWNCYDNNDIQTNDIHKSCVDTWEENDKCSVVKSQNDETVILGCEGETNKKPNCLSVYKDGNTTEVCMEILEESCLGITTPSGLRMLFACRTCNRYKDDIVTYNKEFSRRRRKFIKTYLNNELKGRNSYYRNYFEILINEEVKKPHVPIWLPDSNCYGLALDNKENVLFKCTDREFSKPGCFKVTTSGGKDETDICAFIYEENCVIIVTPKGKQIILVCHDENVGKGQVFAESELQNFRNGMYTFDDTDIDIKQIYNTGKNCEQQVEDYQTQWLHEHQCWGAVTPGLETILLECPYNKNEIKNGCFQVYTQKYGADNEIVPSSYENYETCIKVINDKCVGVVTRKGWHVQLSCYK